MVTTLRKTLSATSEEAVASGGFRRVRSATATGLHSTFSEPADPDYYQIPVKRTLLPREADDRSEADSHADRWR